MTTWKYIGLLNECLRILITVGLGWGLSHLQILSKEDKGRIIPGATKFVFYVALPCLVIQGLGIGIDFYDENIMSWEYICSFLALRVIALFLIIITVSIMTKLNKGRMSQSQQSTTTSTTHNTTTAVGQVVVYWLASTWISTVILGVPISGAVFGNPNLGLKYGVLAAVSSFIFQLPLQLFLLECHSIQASSMSSSSSETDNAHTASNDDNKNDEEAVVSPQEAAPEPPTETKQDSLFDLFFHRGDIWKKLFWHLAVNPVVWAIVTGFILTLSTVGPRFLKPTSDDYVPGLGFIWLTLSWLGDCVSPVSLFSMGVWMQQRQESLRARNIAGESEDDDPAVEGRNHMARVAMKSKTIATAAGFMIIKLILVPLLMVGLAIAIKLDDQSGRAAVLIAALPISLASFTLASRYNIGEDLLSENVVLGTLLVLPTVLGWNAVLDAVGLFPLPGQ